MSSTEVVRVLASAGFAERISAEHLARICADVTIRDFPAGSRICRRGEMADCWVGVVAGSLKIQVTSSEGKGTTLATFSDGCWFGEGTLLKGDCWPFDAVALYDSRVAMLPASAFHWLLENSFPFNRFLIDQLNSRLGQFISRCEHARLHHTDQHVAHCIGELLDPRLYPFPERAQLRMSQEELANLAGVSRAVVNKVLNELARSGIVRISYGAISLIDAQGLRHFSESPH
jgi:CRP/FNR family cyclic AMP-dependent transcriptional regulator